MNLRFRDPVGKFRVTPKRIILGVARVAKAITTATYLETRNRVRNAPVVGDGAVVTLTTHGHRVQRVHLAIESIAWGRVRPRRLILWLDDRAAFGSLPPALKRLQQRGLEVKLSDNYGPHTKYYPYLREEWNGLDGLVTADDDLLYPRDWLGSLLAKVDANPQFQDVVCHRAHRIVLSDQNRMAEYVKWQSVRDERPSFLNFATGVSGVYYPPSLLAHVLEQGDKFRYLAPAADDVWLHAAALRSGHRVRQTSSRPRMFLSVPGTQRHSLLAQNVANNRNDEQIANVYDAKDVARLREEARTQERRATSDPI